MIQDPDRPLPTDRTYRQSLIHTSRGWIVMGQPTEAAEVQFKRMRAELGELCPDSGDHGVALTASMFTRGLHEIGVL